MTSPTSVLSVCLYVFNKKKNAILWVMMELMIEERTTQTIDLVFF